MRKLMTERKREVLLVASLTKGDLGGSERHTHARRDHGEYGDIT